MAKSHPPLPPKRHGARKHLPHRARKHLTKRFASKGRLALFLAVLGPGIIAGLSDDDPAGITTYSIIGAEYGYKLIWVLLLATIMLITFHLIGAKLGAVTGKGLMYLMHDHYKPLSVLVTIICLTVANAGTTIAEFAAIAAVAKLFHLPVAPVVIMCALGIILVLLFASFHRVEHILLAISLLLGAYIISGTMAHPDWDAALHGMAVPSMPIDQKAIMAVAAIIGTTIAPWGIAFIQSYVADKNIQANQLKYERIDVITGAVMTGIIGFFVILACSATLFATNHSIQDAADAALALKPLAGHYAALLFGIGLGGAALLGAAIVPLSTAYSVAETWNKRAKIDSTLSHEHLFNATYIGMVFFATLLVLLPNIPLIKIIYLSQILNAILLLPLLVVMTRLSSKPSLMGNYTNTKIENVFAWGTIGLVASSSLLVLAFTFFKIG